MQERILFRLQNYRLMAIIRKLGANIGAEITDVNVKSLAGKTFEKIYQAWLDFGVTVVRDQDLTIEDFIAYGRRFGEIVRRSRCLVSKNLILMEH